MTTRILLFCCLLLAAGSCTIQKQLHSKGFHVEFRKRLHAKDSSVQSPESTYPDRGTVKNPSDSIAGVVVVADKKEDASSMEPEIGIPATKTRHYRFPWKTQPKRVTPEIQVQTQASESRMNQLIHKQQSKRAIKKRSSSFEWRDVLDWVIIIGLTICFIFLIASVPGVSFIQAVVSVLVVVLAVILLGYLISSALGNYQWFWSGR